MKCTSNAEIPQSAELTVKKSIPAEKEPEWIIDDFYSSVFTKIRSLIDSNFF